MEPARFSVFFFSVILSILVIAQPLVYPDVSRGTEPETICNNNVDDDDDSLIDCLDSDCEDDPACDDRETNCTNRVDDDDDSLIDCHDPDCEDHPSCLSNSSVGG